MLLFPMVRKKKYNANAVNFDGTNDYLTRGADLTGVVDGKSGLLNFWINIAGSDGVNQTIMANDNLGGNFYVVRNTSNIIQVVAQDATGNLDLVISADISTVAASGWQHFLASWDVAASAAHVYVNDVEALATGPTLTNDTLDYVGTGAFAIGAEPDGGAKLTGDLADVWVYFNQYLGLSVEANRRKFISASGKPVNLGSTGQNPLSSDPHVFFSGATATWHTNKGSGGGFTENGALTDAASSPSD